jgi:hypothetical protein
MFLLDMDLNAFYDHIPSFLTVLKVAYMFASNDVHVSLLLDVISSANWIRTYIFSYRCVTSSEYFIM